MRRAVPNTSNRRGCGAIQTTALALGLDVEAGEHLRSDDSLATLHWKLERLICGWLDGCEPACELRVELRFCTVAEGRRESRVDW